MIRLRRFQHPFWPVTIISAFVAFLVFVVLVVFHQQTDQWQYLALGGLAVVVVFAHGLAGWLAYTRTQYHIGVWLIAASQIGSTVFAPLFITDYWLIGLFQLVTVPLLVGMANQPKRMPLTLILTLLGAAGMLATDLFITTSRATILTDQPVIILITVSVLILQFAGWTFLLWYSRLRLQAKYRVKLDLVTQQTLIFTAVAGASIILITTVFISQIRASLIQQVGQNFQALAEINANRVANILEQKIEELLIWASQESILQEGLITSAESFPSSELERLAFIDTLEKQWITNRESSETQIQYLNNPPARILNSFIRTRPEHKNLYLINRFGVLLSAVGDKPDQLFFGNETWWQIAWNNGEGGIYLGKLSVDPENKIASLLIVVNVINPQTNQLIGVLVSTFQLDSIQQVVNRSQGEIVGDFTIIADDGMIIAGSNSEIIGESVWQSLLNTGIFQIKNSSTLPDNRASTPRSDWLLGLDHHGNPAVLAYAPLQLDFAINEIPRRVLNWMVVASDTQSNALASVTRSTKIATLVGVITIALVVMAAIAIARVVSRPIEMLTMVTVNISEGDLEHQAKPVGPVELVTLSEAINTLTGRLRSLINNLQEQVTERTAQLEARAEQMATLNRITQEVSSARGLQSALDIIAREMVGLFDVRNTGIALLNDDRTELTVVADYNKEVDGPNAVGIKIPVIGNPSSAQVVETGRSLVVSQVQTNPLTEPIHGIMRRQKTQSLIIVPLLARGEVIGTIGITTGQEERVFSQVELELAETIAGQIAGAIDNARLFTEMGIAKKAAETANQTKSDFLASMSHELRTPLTSILGFTKIIKKRLDERVYPTVNLGDQKTARAVDQVDRNLEIIKAEGERLTELINNLLDLAKIEAGKVEWHMESISIYDVIQSAIAATTALFDEKENLSMISKLQDGLPQITGDKDKLIQVIINLISNAVKFTDEGQVTCEAKQLNNEILVEVKDTGTGLAEDDLERIFDKFTQAGDMMTSKPRGTGLGLPICKEIVEYHHGRIWAESQQGIGSTFSFTLPLDLETNNRSN